jgi:HlyD family secretion protein
LKKKPVRIILALFILAAAGVAIFVYYSVRGKNSRFVSATGIMDGREVNLAPKVAGRISLICCNEGDPVEEGQLAITLESDDIKASVDQAIAGIERARADIKVSRAAVESAEAGIRSADADIKSAEADLEKTRVQMDEAQREAGRAEELHKKEFISKESRDQTVANADAAVAQFKSDGAKLNAARSKREAAVAQLKTSVNQLNSSGAALKQAEANLAFNKSKLNDTTILSPVTGTVIFKSMEKGETVSPGVTILTVVDLNSLYARTDIDEQRVGWLALGSPASLTVEGMPGKVFRGKVTEIGRYGEFATQRDVPRGREDIKTFRVKIKVDDPGGLLKPGMTVEAEIEKKR